MKKWKKIAKLATEIIIEVIDAILKEREKEAEK